MYAFVLYGRTCWLSGVHGHFSYVVTGNYIPVYSAGLLIYVRNFRNENTIQTSPTFKKPLFLAVRTNKHKSLIFLLEVRFSADFTLRHHLIKCDTNFISILNTVWHRQYALDWWVHGLKSEVNFCYRIWRENKCSFTLITGVCNRGFNWV